VHPAKIEVRFRRSQFVHDFTRDAIRQALMSVRPIASFAAAAGTTPYAQQHGTCTPPNASMPPVTPAPPESGILRAVIPPLHALGVRPGVGSDGGFDRPSARLQPLPQRFTCEPGATISGDASSLTRQRATLPDRVANLAGP